jgi:phosphoglycerate dehydrogenase-like enzyme
VQRERIAAACGGRPVEICILDDLTDLDRIDPADAEVLVSEDVPRDLARWPKLRFVQLLSAGVNQLQDHPVWDSPIVVATAAGTHAVVMAQYVTSALLMLVHHLPRATAFKTTRQWPDRLSMASTMVRGQTAGLIGYGGIGRECARQLHALGMRIVCLKHRPQQRRHEGFVAFDGTGDPAGELPEQWFGPDQLREMLPQCDVLLVTAPRTAESAGMIGPEELALLPAGARVVVVSRGGIVNESALAEALRSGRLAGAAVDAYLEEPPSRDNPLFDAPNLVMTPHISGVFDDYWIIACEVLCRNLRRYVHGEPVLNRADGRRGY